MPSGALCLLGRRPPGAPRLGLAAKRAFVTKSSSPTKLLTTLHLQQSFSFPDHNIVYWLAVAPSLSTRLPSAATPTPTSYACWCSLHLRPAFLSTAMDPFPEHTPKQASQTEPTIEEVKEWDVDELLKWIHKKRPGLLKGNKDDKFREAEISGVYITILLPHIISLTSLDTKPI